MSELRERLVRRSERFDLPRDALGRMFERGARLQRRRRLAAGILALTIGVTGTVLAFSSLRGVGPTPANHTTSSPAGGSIPDGTYWTPPITRDQITATLRREGFTRRQAKELYFDPLTIPFDKWIQQGLVIQDGFWFQTARNSAGQEEAGWGGEFHVVDPHRVQATDNVCTITYGFSVSGDTVSLRVIHEVGPPADCKMDVIPQTAIYESASFIAASATPSPPA